MRRDRALGTRPWTGRAGMRRAGASRRQAPVRGGGPSLSEVWRWRAAATRRTRCGALGENKLHGVVHVGGRPEVQDVPKVETACPWSRVWSAAEAGRGARALAPTMCGGQGAGFEARRAPCRFVLASLSKYMTWNPSETK
jgi:hypothetical protein